MISSKEVDLGEISLFDTAARIVMHINKAGHIRVNKTTVTRSP